jgi:hypothetical protein
MSKEHMKITKPLRARNKFLRENNERKAFEAKVRQEISDKLSVAERLTKLDVGGYVAAKERIKLHQKIAAAPVVALNVEVASVAAPVEKKPKFKKGAKPKKEKK